MRGLLGKCWSIFLIVGCLMLVQGAPVLALSAVATIQANEISVGDAVQLSIQVSGTTSAGNPQFGGIDGLEIRYLGPSTQVQIVNGKYSSSVTYNYTVLAMKAGQFQLGPFEVNAGGEKVTTNAITLTVTDSQGGSPGGGTNNQSPSSQQRNDSAGQSSMGNKLFMEMQIPRTRIYLGERIPVKIRVYIGDVRLENLSYPLLNQTEVALGKMDKPAQRNTVVNGISYQLVEFSSVLTFVKTGRFNLGPVTLDCNVLVRGRSRGWDPFGDNDFGDFFGGGYERYQVQLKTKPVAMNVLPVPDNGKPNDFSGAIGKFKMNVTASPTEVLQGDPITVKMTIAGEGYLQSVAAPRMPNTFGFKAYDAQKKSAPWEQAGDRVVFEQVLIPVDCSVKQVGPFHFSFFDPGMGSYKEITSPAIPVNITPNPNFKTSLVMSDSVTKSEQLGRDLVFIKDAPGNLRLKGTRVYTEFWFWLLQLLPLLLMGAALYYRKYTEMLQSDTPRSRALRAGGAAGKQLVKANELLTAGKFEELLEHLHRMLREYLGEKYKLPSAGMMADVVERLKTENVEEAVLQDVREFFTRYDFCHFAGARLGEGEAKDLYEMVSRVVRSLNQKSTVKGRGKGQMSQVKGRKV